MATYVLENSETVGRDVYIFGRDVDKNEVKEFKISNFDQHLYVKCREEIAECRSCYNEPIRKITFKTAKEQDILKRKYNKSYDGDLKRDFQFLLEKDIRYAFDENLNPVERDVLPPRVCYYDIEVSTSDTAFPTPERAEHPIVAISVKDSYTGDELVFTFGAMQSVGEHHVCCRNERHLIESWCDWVAEYDFDVLTGWYNLGFDWLYILNRSKIVGADLSPLSRIVTMSPDVKHIYGRSHIDMMDLFKLWSQMMGQLDAYDLKSISADPRFGNFAYEDFGAKVNLLVESGDWETLVQYSLNDVRALATIDTNCGLFKFIEGLRKITGVRLEQYRQKTRLIESLLYYEFHIPLPTRIFHESRDFEGAYVLKPTPGLKEWVGGLDIACVDGDTDVLTDIGWVNIADVTQSHKVASLDTSSDNMEFVDVEHTHKYMYDGEMYKCDKHNVKFLITPNHRVLYNKHDDRSQTYYSDEYECMEIQDVVKKYTSHPLKFPQSSFKSWVGNHYDTVVIGDDVVDANSFFRFVGLWLADGCYTSRKSVARSMVVSQATIENLESVRSIVSSLYPKMTEHVYNKPDNRLDEHIFSINNSAWARWFVDNFGHHSSRDKYIPRWMLDASVDNLNALWEGLFLGDGSPDRHGTKSYRTISKNLADGVQELLLKLGHHVHSRYSKRSGMYKVSVNQRNTSNVFRGFYITKEHYNGYVYCLTTKHGNFVIRKDGVTHVTGNSLYPSIIVGNNISPDAFNMIPRAIVKLMEERERLRAIRMKTGDEIVAITEQAVKSLVNSFYGAMGYSGFRLFDAEKVALVPKIGQDIVKNIHAFCRDEGFNVEYGDSVAGDTIINVVGDDDSENHVRIDSLFTSVDVSKPNGKEYCNLCGVRVHSLDDRGYSFLCNVPYIMRHKVDKQMYRVWCESNKIHIDVTEDHSLFHYSDDMFKQISPKDCIVGKTILLRHWGLGSRCSYVSKVEKIDYDGYVYDLSVDDKNHRYFANSILVHNTDSVYLSPITDPESGIIIQEKINAYLRQLAIDNNVIESLASHIKLEKIYSKLVFKAKIGSDEGAKKSYAGRYVWKDGRVESGIDYVGIDVKRSDRARITKETMRGFFERLLIDENEDDAVLFVKGAYYRVVSGDAELTEIGIPQGVSDPEANRPHARGVKNFERIFNRPLPQQKKPRLVVCKRPVTEICIDDDVTKAMFAAVGIDVNWSDMGDRTVARKMKPLFEAINRDWDREIEMQRSLADFL